MIVNRYLNIKLSLMLLFSTSVNNLLIHSAGCCKCCKGKNNDGNGKAIKQKKLKISIGDDGKKITDVTLDGNSIKQGDWDVNLNEVNGIVHGNFNDYASVVKIGKDLFESITTDFKNLKVNINDETIEKYLCAVVKNKDGSCYIVFSTESTNTVEEEKAVCTYGLFNDSTNSSIYILRNQGLESLFALFLGCDNLTKLDLSKLDTSKVTEMSKMFFECKELTTLNLSSFDTTSVTLMYNMFDGCSNLINLDLSNFNTEKVTDMHDMFKGCSSLKELNLSNFNTQNVINMSCMFTACRKLSTISLPGIQNDTCNYSSMLKSCTILQNLQIIYQADKTPSKGLIEYLILNNYENTGLPMEKNGTISISYTKKNQAD